MESFRIYAIEYERREALAAELYLRRLDRDPVTMNYSIWAIVGQTATVVVDTGYTRETAVSRGRGLKRSPEEGLKLIGIEPRDVAHVILSHFHWDHVGNLDLFPKATFYAQEKEMMFWTGRHARYPIFRDVVEPRDMTALVSLNMAGRLVLVNGTRSLLPGITLHRTGGHTPGTQIVEVETAKGHAVIASDAVKTYRNLSENAPDPFVHNVAEMLDGYERVRELASHESLIFPGHDPDVLTRHGMVAPGISMVE